MRGARPKRVGRDAALLAVDIELQQCHFSRFRARRSFSHMTSRSFDFQYIAAPLRT